jgi:hypothetical protein
MIGQIRILRFRRGVNRATDNDQCQISFQENGIYKMFVPNNNSRQDLIELAYSGEFMLCREGMVIHKTSTNQIICVELLTDLKFGYANFKNERNIWCANTTVQGQPVRLTLDRGCDTPMSGGTFKFECLKVTQSEDAVPHIYVKILFKGVTKEVIPVKAVA